MSTSTRPTTTSTIRWWSGLRPLLIRLHFYVGLFVGPFILIAAVTGLLYTLTPQLSDLVHRNELRVAPPAPGAAAVTLTDQIAAAQRAVPDGTIQQVRPPNGPEDTTRVTFATPRDREGYATTAFVDPYRSEVRGVLPTYGEWLPIRSWFDELHRNLLLGEVGRLYSELAASWLWVLAVSGIALWVGRTRRRHRLRSILVPETSSRGRRRLLSWHATVGLWALLGLLFLSATGLTWSQYAGGNVSQLRAQFDWSTPSPDNTLPGGEGQPRDSRTVAGQAEQALALARRAGLTGPVELIAPAAETAWTVNEVKRSWPVQADAVTIDVQRGQVLDRVDFDDWPLMAKLANWGIDAHMGILFGPLNQALLAGLTLGVICLVGWGYRMWWRRRPTRPDRTLELADHPAGPRPPDRIASLIVAAVGIAVGLFLPVLGGSLLIFLLIDAIRSSARARSRP